MKKMNIFYNSKHFLNVLLLVIILLGINTPAWAQTYNGTTWYSLYDTNEYSKSTNTGGDIHKYTGVFVPVSSTVTLETKIEGRPLGVNPSGYKIQIGNALITISDDEVSSSQYYTTGWLGSKTYYWNYIPKSGSGVNGGTESSTISVEYEYKLANATRSVYIKNIKIPMAKHIRLKSSSNDKGITDQTLTAFSNTTWGTTNASPKTVRFRSFLTSGDIRITCDKPEIFRLGSADNTDGITYAVGSNAFAYESGSDACSAGHAGATSNYNFNVYFCPAEAKEYTATITITDGASTATVHVSGTGIKRDQTINDFTTVKTKTTDSFDFDAYTTDKTSGNANELPVKYSSNNLSVATINETTGVVTIIKDGIVTFTATQEGNDDYNSTSKTVTWNISKVTPTVIWPVVASGLKYNESCAIGDKVSDHWTGGSAVDDKDNSVEGTFTCNEALQPAKNSDGYTVIFLPTNTNWYNSTNTTIKKDVAKADQTITWDLVEGREYETGTLMDATATSNVEGLEVSYSSNHPEWGYIDGDNKLQVVVPNKEITITATQAGNANWNAADPVVTKTFTTCGSKPNNWDDVSATGLVYGQSLAESALSGDVKLNESVIAGTLAWVDPALVPNAGTSAYEVEFTPENQNAYGSVTFKVSVAVAKADPVLTWNIGENLRANSNYSNIVASSNKETGLSIITSTNLSFAGNVLTTGDVAKNTTQNGWIKVSQPATDNYNALSETLYNVTIKPRVDVCLPLVMDQSIFNEAVVGTKDNVEWYNTNENGYKENYIAHIDVTYTQRVGIGLGKWTEGLDGLTSAVWNWIRGKSTEFAYTDKWMDFSFTGVPDQITFDVESQAVTSSPPSVTWPTTAANWYLYESADGSNYTQVGAQFASGNHISRTLKPETRYIRIKYSGNFTGFIKNLEVSQKKYLRTKNNVTEKTFGTEENPLQEPQTVTIEYSSLGDCEHKNTAISVSIDNPAFYVDESSITDNVGLDQMGEYTVRVRCNDVNQTGTLAFTAFDGTAASVTLRSTNPAITSAATAIFRTGTEHAPADGTLYRTQRTHDFSACFNGASPVYDTLYIYGVSESAEDNRQWVNDASKDYKVPEVTSSNVHTPCFVYKKEGAQYTYVRTFDAAATTLNIADSDKELGFVGYKPASLAAAIPAIRINGANNKVYFNDTEILSNGAVLAVNATQSIYACGVNILSSAGDAAVKLSGTTTLSIEDNWISGEASGVLALRPATSYPSIDLGSANGRVDINGTRLELHNATNMAIAHMDGTTERFDGEVHINDGSVGGEETLGMPKMTFIDGGTFNDGTVAVYTLKGVAKRPRNSRGEIVSRQTMAPETLVEEYSWYGHAHITVDDEAKVNPMLMDEEVWIFTDNGDNEKSDDPTNWNKGSGLPGEDDDVLINAPMVVSGGELKVRSLTINWKDKGKGTPAVTVKPDGGLTVGEGGIDGIKVDMVENLALRAGTEGANKGQTGFLRIHPESAEPMPEATVELFSIGYYDYDDKSENIAKWQYVGSPLASSDVLAKTIYKKSWVYAWDEETNEWSNQRATFKLTPFVGFATTQRTYAEGILLTYAGQIVSSETNTTIPLSYSGKGHGENVIANSFVAPIDITNFEDEDFVNIDSTIYIFNTGSRSDEETAKMTKNIDAPGQYLAIPIGSARLLKGAFGLPTVIAPMQGFCVHAINENAEIKLNYEKLVWNGDFVANANAPLRAKAHYSEEDSENIGALRISLNANGWTDHLFMIESEQFNTKYEGGYDARKWMGDELNIFAVENNDKLSVDATNSIAGTRVGVRTGEEMTYTMKFSHMDSETPLVLWDKEARFKMLISEETEYTFNAEPNSEITERFQIIAADIPAVTTGVEDIESETKVTKFIKDNQLYILKDGVLYNATGAVVRK